MKKFVSFVLAVAPLARAGAQVGIEPDLVMNPLVVTASRMEQPVSETAPSITVITAEDIARKGAATVTELLREVPGVEVAEAGPLGSATSVFIRGSASEHVLVLIDGVRVNSPTLGSFDFADLTTENVERIEILRGFGGTLYGSEAVGGVIQIFTRRGEGPPRGSISVAGGNAGTDREVAEVSGESGVFSYSGSASHLHTDGFKRENDDLSNTVVSARVAAHVAKDATATFLFRVGEARFGNFFSNNFLAAPDPNARQDDGFAIGRVEWSQRLAPALGVRASFGYTREDQSFDDLPDAAETSTTHSSVLGQIYTGNAEATLAGWGDRLQGLFGAEYEAQSGSVDSTFSDPSFGSSRTRFDRNIRNVAGYTLQQLFLDDRRLVVTGGVRLDDNQRFGRAVSPSGGVSYAIAATDTRLRATYAEGFKAPTLNQLFFPGFGNAALGAETSWEADGGFDQRLPASAALSATVFHRRVHDLIEAVPQASSGLLLAENVGEATADGVESALEIEVLAGIRVGGEYTFLDLAASPSGRVRKARHSGSLHAAAERDSAWTKGDRLSLDLRLLLVGDRFDFDPAAGFALRDNPAYQRADLAASYGFPVALGALSRLGAFIRIENLFDRHYQEVLGFGARPLNFLAGLRGEFS